MENLINKEESMEEKEIVKAGPIEYCPKCENSYTGILKWWRTGYIRFCTNCGCGDYKEIKEEPESNKPEPKIPLSKMFEFTKWVKLSDYTWDYINERWEDKDGYIKTDSELFNLFTEENNK